MYFWMVRLLSRILSFSNSPRIRSAPPKGDSWPSSTCLAFFGPSEAEVTFAVENNSVVW